MVPEPKTTTRTRPRKGMVSLSLLVGSVFWAMSGAGRSTLLDAPQEVTEDDRVELNVKLVRPVPKDETVIAEGRVLNLSRSLGVSEGTLKQADGKLLAHATCTCMIRHG